MKERDDYKIELYRGVERKFFDKISFLPIVRESLEGLLGRSLLLESIQILILNVPEEPLQMEPPIVENLVPDFGYTDIKVYEGDFLIYQHPHRLYDVVTQTLQKKLSEQYPEENWWGFRVDLSEIPEVPTIRLKLLVLTPNYTPALKDSPEKKPSFTVRRLEEENPPIKTLADFGVTSSETGSRMQESSDEISSSIHPVLVKLSTESQTQTSKTPVKVVLKRSLYQDICHERSLSRKVEEGGFLIGKVYRDGEDENIYLLEITNALTAQHTGASFLHLTFTGDSFVEVKRTLNQSYPGERLLGWYHTHLFLATPSFGLSSIDVELHFSTFTIPWQLAGLINVDGNKRTLRFYVRQGNKMILCPYWVIDERD